MTSLISKIDNTLSVYIREVRRYPEDYFVNSADFTREHDPFTFEGTVIALYYSGNAEHGF